MATSNLQGHPWGVPKWGALLSEGVLHLKSYGSWLAMDIILVAPQLAKGRYRPVSD